ncbi:hypothetical protein GCM10028825_03190 [Spirosoma agri]
MSNWGKLWFINSVFVGFQLPVAGELIRPLREAGSPQFCVQILIFSRHRQLVMTAGTMNVSVGQLVRSGITNVYNFNVEMQILVG